MPKLLFTFALFLTLASAGQNWKPGDKVDAYNSGWYDATILEIGSGNMAGYYKVHYDGHPAASDQFLKAANIRAHVSSASAKPATDPSGPRPGKYNCWAYGANPANPLLIDSFEMNRGGSYLSHGKTGKYTFDAASQTVTWESGVNKDNGYKGKFEVENKTHKIRITARALCTNTAP